MATTALRRGGGRVSDVFRLPAERQAAYDFLEHDTVSAVAVRDAQAKATARRCAEHPTVFVVLDGSSVTLADSLKEKPFGSIGKRCGGARGLKVLNALALDSKGVPIGVAEQVWWARTPGKANQKIYRPLEQRESRYWRIAAAAVGERFATLAPQTRIHFLADREGDAAALMLQLLESGHDFTIRSNAVRKALVAGKKRGLRAVLSRRFPMAHKTVELPATAARRARNASLAIRAARLTITLRDRHVKHSKYVELTVVWAREEGRVPLGESRLDWVLFTTLEVVDEVEAREVVTGYTRRWRIEDFHRTWKRGHCRVEQTQLRSQEAVIKWATILASVAARAERLRQRARSAPEVSAEEELTSDEIAALLLLKRQEKRRTEDVPEETPTLARAVRWIADLGGYVGYKSSGPPGATTIARGLERITTAADLLAALRASGRLR